MKNKIVSTHIENNVVNETPTLVFTDQSGAEWVQSLIPSDHGGYLPQLTEKSKCWYFDPKNK